MCDFEKTMEHVRLWRENRRLTNENGILKEANSRLKVGNQKREDQLNQIIDAERAENTQLRADRDYYKSYLEATREEKIDLVEMGEALSESLDRERTENVSLRHDLDTERGEVAKLIEERGYTEDWIRENQAQENRRISQLEVSMNDQLHELRQRLEFLEKAEEERYKKGL